MTASAAEPGEAGEPCQTTDGCPTRLGTFLRGLPPVDPAGLVRRSARLARRGCSPGALAETLDLAIGMVDLTTLEGTDTASTVAELVATGLAPDPSDASCPRVAAICVYPSMVETAARLLAGSGIAVASVATAFPSGQSPLPVRLAETEAAVAAGADEIDMVINRGAFLAGEYQQVFDEIVAVKRSCGPAHLKVILETGELGSYDAVCWASWLAMFAGADFIKTSTGKTSPAATVPVTVVMMEAAGQYFEMTGRKVGIKAAGGIRTTEQALGYLAVLGQVLGPQWCKPQLFRFGASSLLDDLVLARRKATGEVRDPIGQGTPVDPAPAMTTSSATQVDPAPVDMTDLDGAVSAAQTAFRERWGTLTGSERARHLFALADALSSEGPRLVTIQARDGGTPLSTATAETLPVLARLAFGCAGVADKLRWIVPTGSQRSALGVVAIQPPARPDLLAIAETSMRALACGNTVLLCHDRAGAQLNRAFVDLCRSAGLPEGVATLGPPRSATDLLDHRGVDALVAFGGPPGEPGGIVDATSGRLERGDGGSDDGRPTRLIMVPEVTVAILVFADAAMGEAVEAVVTDAFAGRGYLPGLGLLRGARLLLNEPIAETFLAALDRRIGTLRAGDPDDRDTDLPAWIDLSHRGRSPAPEPGPMAGAMDRPALPVATFRTADEAVAKAAKTPGTWCASVWTDKGSNGVWVANALRARQVWLNSATGSNPTCRPGLEAYLG